MKSFEYNAVDELGRAVSGTVEAPDWHAAEELLAARGLQMPRQSMPSEVKPAPIEIPTLNQADALELAVYISQVAKIGLPLDRALESMGQELPSGRLAAAFCAVSAQLAAGQPLETVLDRVHERLPAHTRLLLTSGGNRKELPAALDEMLAHQRTIDDATSQYYQALAYPLTILVFLVVWLLFTALWLIPRMDMQGIMDDFDTTARTHWNTTAVMEFSQIVPRGVLAVTAALLLSLGLAQLIGGRALVSRMVWLVPVAGPAWSSRAVADFCGLLAVGVKLELPLESALQFTAGSARDAAIRLACKRAAERVAKGQSLAQCMRCDTAFPATLVTLVGWGEHNRALGESLADARRMLLERFDLQIRLVRFVVPPIAFLIVAGSALFVVYGFMAFFLKLLRDLA